MCMGVAYINSYSASYGSHDCQTLEERKGEKILKFSRIVSSTNSF